MMPVSESEQRFIMLKLMSQPFEVQNMLESEQKFTKVKLMSQPVDVEICLSQSENSPR